MSFFQLQFSVPARCHNSALSTSPDASCRGIGVPENKLEDIWGAFKQVILFQLWSWDLRLGLGLWLKLHCKRWWWCSGFSVMLRLKSGDGDQG